MRHEMKISVQYPMMRTPTRYDCEHVAQWYRLGYEHTEAFCITLRQLMLAGFCLSFFIGCSTTPKFTVETVTDQFTVTVEGFAAKQDDTITAVKENTEAINKIVVKVQSLEGAILDTRKTMEASLVKSETVNGQEVIKSEDTSPDKNANDSHAANGIVAESGDVPLFVSVAPFCQPCERLKRDYLAGKLDGFDVKFCVQTEAHRDKLIADGIPADRVIVEAYNATPFPAIRYRSSESTTGWKWHVPRGYGPRTLMELRSTLLGEEMPYAVEFPQTFVEPAPTPRQPVMRQSDLVALHNQLHGGGHWTWPGDLAEHLRNTHGVQIDGTASNYSGNQVLRARSSVRSVSRGPVVNWRARSVSRASCPSGSCP